MLGQKPGSQSRQSDVRVSGDMGRQGGLLRRRQFARPVTAPHAGAHLAGPPPADQRLVDVRHADPENRGRQPRRHATVDRRQNPRPQVLRIALPLPPSHHCPPHLAVRSANHTLSALETPFSDSSQCGYALVGRARQLTELRLECIEVDRLSEELGSAKLTCPASALVVAIGGHHHHRDVGEALFDGFEEL